MKKGVKNDVTKGVKNGVKRGVKKGVGQRGVPAIRSGCPRHGGPELSDSQTADLSC